MKRAATKKPPLPEKKKYPSYEDGRVRDEEIKNLQAKRGVSKEEFFQLSRGVSAKRVETLD